MTERFLKRREVEKRTGLSRSTIYRRMDADEFPKPVRDPAGRSVWWRETEISAYIAGLIAARDAR